MPRWYLWTLLTAVLAMLAAWIWATVDAAAAVTVVNVLYGLGGVIAIGPNYADDVVKDAGRYKLLPASRSESTMSRRLPWRTLWALEDAVRERVQHDVEEMLP